MNRRSILSTICTGALALLAPVVARAKPRRWVGFHKRGIKPMVITPREDLTPEQIAEFKRLWRTSTIPPPRVDCGRTPSFSSTCECHHCVTRRHSSLRALLTEARSHLEMWHRTFGTQDECDTEHLLSRIDAALKV